MLFPRRKNLVEKLWSLAKADPKLDAQTNQYGRQQRQQQLQLRNGQRAIDTDTAVFGPMTAKNLDYQWTSNAFQHLQDKLTKVQLESLLKCIKRWETPEVSQPSDCILVSRNNQHLDFDNNLNTIACKIWRWPDLTATDGLRHIPSCTDSDQAYICCNPYHWSRVIDPNEEDTSPPPYEQCSMDKLKPQEYSNDFHQMHGFNQFQGSLTTNGEDASPTSNWCQLAYWELNERVGPIYRVEDPAINVFSSESVRCDGLCLATLASNRKNIVIPNNVIRTRQKIGLGITISREPNGVVWLHNRSTSPIFIHSPTLDGFSKEIYVHRLPPGWCIAAFDPAKVITSTPQYGQCAIPTGPKDPNCFTISFVKGWGKSYSRKELIECPCWLEIFMSRPCR